MESEDVQPKSAASQQQQPEQDDAIDIDDPNRLWCICRQPHNNSFMICCDKCEDWFHGKCVGVTKAQGEAIEVAKEVWHCPPCKKILKQIELLEQQKQREALALSKNRKSVGATKKIETKDKNRKSSTSAQQQQQQKNVQKLTFTSTQQQDHIMQENIVFSSPLVRELLNEADAFSEAEDLDNNSESTPADGQIIENRSAQSCTNNNNIISTTNSLTTLDLLQGKRTKLPSLKIRENQREVNQKLIIDQVARDVGVINQSTEELPIIDEVNRRGNAIDIKDMNQFNQTNSSLSLNNINLGSFKQDKSCKSPVKLSPDVATVNQDKTPATVSVRIPESLLFNANEPSSSNEQHNNNIDKIIESVAVSSNAAGLCLRCLAIVPQVELRLYQKKKMCPNCIFTLQRIKPATISNPNYLQQGDQSASIIGNEEIPSNLSSNEYARKTRLEGPRIILAKKNTTRKNNNTPPRQESQTSNTQTVLQNIPLEIPRSPLLTPSEEMRLERLIQYELQKSEPDLEVIEELMSKQEEVVRRRHLEEGQGEQPGPSQPRTTQTSGTEEASANSLNKDCPHFFKPHGCLMGSRCQVGRHSEAALGCFIECPKWKINNGFCDDWMLCNMRHMHQADIDFHKRRFIDNPEGEIQAKKAKLEEEKEEKKPAQVATKLSLKTIECPVCLEDYDSLLEKDIHLGITDCGHLLCGPCANDILKKEAVDQNICPICRAPLTKQPIPCYF